MYNGIGLKSARGSATSGHIQRNRSYVKPQFVRQNQQNKRKGRNYEGDDVYGSNIHEDIKDHNIKRDLEAKLFEYQVMLEDEGKLNEEEIVIKVADRRRVLTNNQGNEDSGQEKKRKFMNDRQKRKDKDNKTDITMSPSSSSKDIAVEKVITTACDNVTKDAVDNDDDKKSEDGEEDVSESMKKYETNESDNDNDLEDNAGFPMRRVRRSRFSDA